MFAIVNVGIINSPAKVRFINVFRTSIDVECLPLGLPLFGLE